MHGPSSVLLSATAAVALPAAVTSTTSPIEPVTCLLAAHLRTASRNAVIGGTFWAYSTVTRPRPPATSTVPRYGSVGGIANVSSPVSLVWRSTTRPDGKVISTGSAAATLVHANGSLLITRFST